MTARRPAVTAPLGARVLARVRALPDHRLLDRLIRGRAWIPLLGVLLVGIVAMQVEVLKLGASMGRAIERGTALQSTNETLREHVASLADDQRIERLAAAQGMVMPAPAGVGFLSAHAGANVQRALANIHAPSPTSFLALTTTNGAVAAALTTSTAITLTANAASASGGPTAGSTPAASSTSATVPTDPGSTISAAAASAPSSNVPTSAASLPGATGAAVANLPGSTSSSSTSIPATSAASTGASTASGQ